MSLLTRVLQQHENKLSSVTCNIPVSQPRAQPHTEQSTRFALISIVLGLIGWFASFELATEYVHVLKDPDYVPNCNISPLVTCGPNMESWQGSIFGFSNTFIGLTAFTVPVLTGVSLLAEAHFRSWFWWIYILGNFGGVTFVFWLSWQSTFRIGALCPWCIVIWLVMIPLFWMTLTHTTAQGKAALPPALHRVAQELRSWSWVFVALSYIFIAGETQIGVDWIAHIRRTFF